MHACQLLRCAGSDQLQVLDLSGNQLQGNLPASFGPSLQQLLLAKNALAGKYHTKAAMHVAEQATAAAAAVQALPATPAAAAAAIVLTKQQGS